MHRRTALMAHFCTVSGGVIVSGLVGAYLYFMRHMGIKLSTVVFGLINIPFLIAASIILFGMRKNLVVPKYPKDKKLNKKIINYPYVDLGVAAVAVLYFIHNLIFR